MSDLSREELEARLKTFVGVETGPPRVGPEPVNESMIFHWCEALGDENPVYTDAKAAKASVHKGLVAPPTMLQVWGMRGMEMVKPVDTSQDKQGELHQLLTENGYTGVVATNCEQGFARYLKPGDRITAKTLIESISEQKATALGIGYFINTRDTYVDQKGKEVGWMTFRVLKFKPHQQPAQAVPSAGEPQKPTRMRPPMSFDNKWWWEGIQRGELLIQKCSECGALRHPARPMCGKCQSLKWESVKASGRGTIYSHTVVHHPKFPGYEYPLICVLIELEEGTRLVSNLIGCDPSEVRIGMPVEMILEQLDDEMKFPLFRPVK